MFCNMDNPWRGLLSYKDPEKSQKQYKFCGRESAVSSIFAMVDNNLLVTLYGKTGIGKTSILNAGVFPLLRSRNYLPISIRLGRYAKEEKSFAKYIIDEIENEIFEQKITVKTLFPQNSDDNSFGIEFLWKYFLTRTFVNAKEEVVYPVIALDQFEEIFVSDPNKTTLLLKQIYTLLDDNREIPNIEGYSDYTNFRFILSIREDDLFYLEDCIDLNHLPLMKQNRYRLCSLTEKEAYDVVLIGKDYIKEGEEEEVAVRITNLSKDDNGHISTNILSLVCSQLFLQSSGNINSQILNEFSENPLESFYKDCISQVDPKTSLFIENHLIEQDRRKFVSKRDLYLSVPDKDIKILSEGEYRILQRVSAGNTECVELIHDSLAKTIYHFKAENQQHIQQQKLLKNIKFRKYIIYGLLLFLVSSIAYIVILKKKNNDIEIRGTKVVVNLFEDSLVVANNYYWVANLQIIATKNNKDSVLIDKVINKSQRDIPIEFNTDSVTSIRVKLSFDDEKYGDFLDYDKKINNSYLIQHPNIKILIEKIKKKQYVYNSRIVVDIDGKEIALQNAMVILHDQIQYTDSKGNITFNLTEPVDSTDYIYVVRQGFNCFETQNILVENKLIPKIVIHSDNISAFRILCNNFDSIPSSEWKYTTVTNRYPEGLPVDYKSRESGDRIVFFGKILGSNNEKYAIDGFYYFQKEYTLNKGKEYQSYHLFKGFIDRQWRNGIKGKYKIYDIESFDYVGNKQQIVGHFTYKNGLLDGILMQANDTIASFGK